MKRVIITGPTGVVGMALIRYLSERGIQVIAVVRPDSSRKSQIRESESIIKVECPLAEISGLSGKVKEAFLRRGQSVWQNIDVFYHLAWDGTYADSRDDLYLQNRNVAYALEAVDAAAKLGCRLFIGAGSQAEYGRYEGKLHAKLPVFPENGYGMAKLCAGQMTRSQCEKKGLGHIWTRILSVYGPYDNARTMVMGSIQKMLRGERVSCTKGEQLWDYLYAADAAKMMYLLGKYGKCGSTYCLGSGEARPLKEYMEIIRSIVSPQADIGYGEIAYSPKQVMHLCADIREIVIDTGYQPDYTFESGIRQTMEWCLKYNM